MKIIIDQQKLREKEKVFMIKEILWALVIIANLAFILGAILHSL